MDKRKSVIVALVAIGSLVFAGIFLLGDQEGRRKGPGTYNGKNGSSMFPGNFSEYANNSEVQALFQEMKEAKKAGDMEREEEIRLQLEGMGLQMSAGKPPSFSPTND